MKDWGTGAQAALAQSGAIKPCPEHFDVYLRSHDKDAEKHAYAIGTNMLKFGEVREGPRTEFMTLIDETLDQTSDRCFICQAAYEFGD